MRARLATIRGDSGHRRSKVHLTTIRGDSGHLTGLQFGQVFEVDLALQPQPEQRRDLQGSAVVSCCQMVVVLQPASCGGGGGAAAAAAVSWW